jgi:hypothetical protein
MFVQRQSGRCWVDGLVSEMVIDMQRGWKRSKHAVRSASGGGVRPPIVDQDLQEMCHAPYHGAQCYTMTSGKPKTT